MAKDKDYHFLRMLQAHERELMEQLSAARSLINFTQNRIDGFLNDNHIICDYPKCWAYAGYQKQNKKDITAFLCQSHYEKGEHSKAFQSVISKLRYSRKQHLQTNQKGNESNE